MQCLAWWAASTNHRGSMHQPAADTPAADTRARACVRVHACIAALTPTCMYACPSSMQAQPGACHQRQRRSMCMRCAHARVIVYVLATHAVPQQHQCATLQTHAALPAAAKPAVRGCGTRTHAAHMRVKTHARARHPICRACAAAARSAPAASWIPAKSMPAAASRPGLARRDVHGAISRPTARACQRGCGSACRASQNDYRIV